MNDTFHFTDALDVAEQLGNEIYETPRFGRISKEQGLLLLTRLVEDDAFRARYEQAPAQALLELGIPAAQVFSLKEDCRKHRTLACKEVLSATRRRLVANLDTSMLEFAIPNIRL